MKYFLVNFTHSLSITEAIISAPTPYCGQFLTSFSCFITDFLLCTIFSATFLTSSLLPHVTILPSLGPAFDYLDAPILRVTGADVPMPYTKSLEAMATPQPENVVRTVLKMLNME